MRASNISFKSVFDCTRLVIEYLRVLWQRKCDIGGFLAKYPVAKIILG